MDNNMPSMTDLSTIYGSYSPELYMHGRQQVNQSNQMVEQGIEKSRLANMFSAQQNPQLLEHQRLQNEGLGFDNTSKGVKSRFDVATEGFKLDDAKRAQALAAPEHEIKMMGVKAEQMMYNPDPAVQAKGRQLMEMSKAAVEARQKHQWEMDKQDLIRKSAERVGAGNNTATIRAAQIAADSRKAAGAKSADPKVIAAKLGFEKGAAYYAIQAEQTDDPDEKAKLLDMAGRFERANLAQKNAGAAGKLDIGDVTGMPTVQPNLQFGQPSATPPANLAQKPVAAPPQGAVQMLRSNPSLASQFDAKYGPGASKQFLGQ